MSGRFLDRQQGDFAIRATITHQQAVRDGGSAPDGLMKFIWEADIRAAPYFNRSRGVPLAEGEQVGGDYRIA